MTKNQFTEKKLLRPAVILLASAEAWDFNDQSMIQPIVDTPPLASDAALVQRIRAFISDTKWPSLIRKYEINLERQKRSKEIGFNVFELISRQYYRENLHSDILAAFLDPKGQHQENGKFLDCFLSFIKAHRSSINLTHYAAAQVEREEGRIDILIKGSGRAIIIENKINGACDQPQQLPDYLKKVTDDKCVCDAIVYLRLEKGLGPDTTTWTLQQVNEVIPLLVRISACEDNPDDLLNGWIRISEKAATPNSNAQHILRQYGDIIQKLGGDIMNKPVMEEFCNIVFEGDNFKTAMRLKELLGKVRYYAAERIVDKFESNFAPFQKPAPWENGAHFNGAKCGQAEFALWIWVDDEQGFYEIWFFDSKDKDIGAKGYAKKMLEEMGCVHEFNFDLGKFKRRFEFPAQEKALFQYVGAFKDSLKAKIPSFQGAT